MVDVIIPVYKPDQKFYELLERLLKQNYKPEHIILMYTMTTEEEYDVFKAAACGLVEKYTKGDTILDIHQVEKENFSHGKTRNEGVSYGHNPYVLLMTQDAIPSDTHLIDKMMDILEAYPEVSQVYARQKTDGKAPAYIKLTQRFNYPKENSFKTKDDYKRLGIKTIFCSDVCCMYRRDIFEYIGGFDDVIFNEDMIYARKVIDGGFTIGYAGEASVIHYHKYNCREQFKRNFDLAVSQSMHPETFGDLSSVKEGSKMVKTILVSLLKKGHVLQFFYYIVWSGFKFMGYRLGKNYKRIPNFLCKKFSLTPVYWKK